MPVTRTVTSLAHPPADPSRADDPGVSSSDDAYPGAAIASDAYPDAATPPAAVATPGTDDAFASDADDVSGHDATADAPEQESLTDVLESGKTFGTALHRVLELTRLDPAADIPALVAQVAAPHPNINTEKLTEMVEWTLATPPLEEARATGRYWLELDVVAPGADGVVIVGRADFAYIDADGKLVVVDFKTDSNPRQQRSAEYAVQVRTYLREIARTAGVPEGRGYLIFAAPEQRRIQEV